MKKYYNRRHQPITFQPGQKAYLRLHRGYSVPGVHRKYGPQFVGPFEIEARVGKLAYRMKFPTHWKIHNVVSVTQLEPAATEDPYQRRHAQPPAVHDERFPHDADRYEVEKILNKRTRRYGRGQRDEYLVRWLGYGPEDDTWIPRHNLDGAEEALRLFEGV
jgi:hypothetical protein